MNLKITVLVKTNKKEQSIKYDPERDIYFVNLKALPIKNEANEELLKILKDHFNMKPKIISGEHSNKKIVELI